MLKKLLQFGRRGMIAPKTISPTWDNPKLLESPFALSGPLLSFLYKFRGVPFKVDQHGNFTMK